MHFYEPCMRLADLVVVREFEQLVHEDASHKLECLIDAVKPSRRAEKALKLSQELLLKQTVVDFREYVASVCAKHLSLFEITIGLNDPTNRHGKAWAKSLRYLRIGILAHRLRLAERLGRLHGRLTVATKRSKRWMP